MAGRFDGREGWRSTRWSSAILDNVSDSAPDDAVGGDAALATRLLASGVGQPQVQFRMSLSGSLRVSWIELPVWYQL
jgi:hypothetical protein